MRKADIFDTLSVITTTAFLYSCQSGNEVEEMKTVPGEAIMEQLLQKMCQSGRVRNCICI